MALKDGSGQSKEYNTADLAKVLSKTADRAPLPKEQDRHESTGRNASNE